MLKCDAIWKRKSCRSFTSKSIKEGDLKEILRAGQQAPSPKNSQPWRFLVIEDQDKKEKVAEILEKSIKMLEEDCKKKGVVRRELGLAMESVKIIREAPVLMFVYMNTEGMMYHDDGVQWSLHARDVECTYIMAVGAAIENMLLEATEIGIDSLWMCDIFYAYRELERFLGYDGVIMAAVLLGYGDDNKNKKGKKALEQIVKWY